MAVLVAPSLAVAAVGPTKPVAAVGPTKPVVVVAPTKPVAAEPVDVEFVVEYFVFLPLQVLPVLVKPFFPHHVFHDGIRTSTKAYKRNLQILL